MLIIPPANISQFIKIFDHTFHHSIQEVTSPEQIIPIATTTDRTHIGKYVALTFDDGPYGTSTDRILTILEKEKVAATFFLIGKNVEAHPEQVRREIADGDVIGNHSYSHSKQLPVMSSSVLRADISRGKDAIIKASCLSPHLFRPPYSRTSPTMIKEIIGEGYVFAGWTVDPRDWDNANSSTTIVSNVLNFVQANSIIIMHDGHEIGTDYSRQNTIDALPVIIETLKQKGYTFVTIDTLLHTNPYVASSSPITCNK